MFQPFRGNPDYDKVANLPYDSRCLAGLTQGQEEINIRSIARCRMETMYDTACMNDKVSRHVELWGFINSLQHSSIHYTDLTSKGILYLLFLKACFLHVVINIGNWTVFHSWTQI